SYGGGRDSGFRRFEADDHEASEGARALRGGGADGEGAHARAQAQCRRSRRCGRVVRSAAGVVGAHVRRCARPARRRRGRRMTDSAPHEDPSVLRLERICGASVARVFEVWTSAELLRRWYPPGADWDTPVAEVDLRVGGALRLVMRSPDGEEFGGGGHYREIT